MWLEGTCRASIRITCGLMRLSKTVYCYQTRRDPDTVLRHRTHEITRSRGLCSYLRIHTLLVREDWHINRKKVNRISYEEGLNLRIKRPRYRVSAARRLDYSELTKRDQYRSMDFVADELCSGHRFWPLTVVDNFSRECLMIHVNQHIRGEQVVEVMESQG